VLEDLAEGLEESPQRRLVSLQASLRGKACSATKMRVAAHMDVQTDMDIGELVVL